ncbi:MAG: division/cell wall cluster transcriptional repressor MraZ [Nitrospira sp.]|nr:division/cell wall cluster transcriptional repressor MraZ [bacterium]MBL7048187.1 division/cell wall cluster transcriptional repressor MraZ [Nitrospira sp.]
MPGFSGKHYNALDSKGRLIVPAPFREVLSSIHSSKLIVTNDVFDRCLCAYPAEDWQKLLDKVSQMPQTDDAVKFFMRRVIGSAVQCEIDKQGRVLVSSALRIDAGLNSEVVLLGLGSKIEIWSKGEFEGVADPSKVDKEAFKTKFAALGL